MKPRLKIGFADFFEPLDKFFIEILKVYYDVEVDNENPEFLFFSTEDFGVSNKRFDSRPEVTKILFTGENRRAQHYSCHYAITFDHIYQPWHYRLPLYVVDMWCIPNASGLTQYPYDHLFNKPKPETIKRDLFCGFVHRNGNNEVRNRFFHDLSKYKQVTSAGPLFNNNGGVNVEGIGGKIDFFKRCKFALCFENSAEPGYVTEKILHAFYAGAIPIYWGSPTIGKDFNEKAMINAMTLGTPQNVIDFTKKIDYNDDLYNAMLKEPKTAYNLPNDCMVLGAFLSWFDSIVYEKRYQKQ